jgi:hypothetical protein
LSRKICLEKFFYKIPAKRKDAQMAAFAFVKADFEPVGGRESIPGNNSHAVPT